MVEYSKIIYDENFNQIVIVLIMSIMSTIDESVYSMHPHDQQFVRSRPRWKVSGGLYINNSPESSVQMRLGGNNTPYYPSLKCNMSHVEADSVYKCSTRSHNPTNCISDGQKYCR